MAALLQEHARTIQGQWQKKLVKAVSALRIMENHKQHQPRISTCLADLCAALKQSLKGDTSSLSGISHIADSFLAAPIVQPRQPASGSHSHRSPIVNRIQEDAIEEAKETLNVTGTRNDPSLGEYDVASAYYALSAVDVTNPNQSGLNLSVTT